MKNKILIFLSLFLCYPLFADIVSYYPIINKEGEIYRLLILLSSIITVFCLLTMLCIKIYGLCKKKSYKSILSRMTIIFIISIIICGVSFGLFAVRGFRIEEHRPSYPPEEDYGSLDTTVR